MAAGKGRNVLLLGCGYWLVGDYALSTAPYFCMHGLGWREEEKEEEKKKKEREGEEKERKGKEEEGEGIQKDEGGRLFRVLGE